MPNRVPLPLERIRELIYIRLSVVPAFWFKNLWSPQIRDKERQREDLVEHLTKGWETWEVTREERSTFDPPSTTGI